MIFLLLSKVQIPPSSIFSISLHLLTHGSCCCEITHLLCSAHMDLKMLTRGVVSLEEQSLFLLPHRLVTKSVLMIVRPKLLISLFGMIFTYFSEGLNQFLVFILVLKWEALTTGHSWLLPRKKHILLISTSAQKTWGVILQRS